MVAGGGLAVEDMHVQLGNSQRNEHHGDGHKSDADFRVSLSRPVHPKIVIAAGSNQTQVSFNLRKSLRDSCFFVDVFFFAAGRKRGNQGKK